MIALVRVSESKDLQDSHEVLFRVSINYPSALSPGPWMATNTHTHFSPYELQENIFPGFTAQIQQMACSVVCAKVMDQHQQQQEVLGL